MVPRVVLRKLETAAPIFVGIEETEDRTIEGGAREILLNVPISINGESGLDLQEPT